MCFLRPGSLIFSQRKKPLYQVHSGFFPILCFFWGCKFKGSALAKSGSALATQTKSANRQRPTNAAKPSPARPAAPANFGAYIGRLGMRTVKVVPLPGTLST